MTKRIPVPENLIVSISAYLKNHNLGNRGVEDGSRRKQEIGLIGELMVYHYLLGNYPNLNERTDGFDGGYDFRFQDKRIDVKTMERKTYVKPSFVNNFYLLQESHKADIIVFCSYNSVDNVLEICGWLPKNELGIRGIFYAAGTKRIRSDGSTFVFRQDNYEVENKNLNDIDNM
jgi:hypothetical protein